MEIVDFHNHYYPPEYLEAIKRGPSKIRVTVDGEGNPVLHSPGDINVAVPGHRDLALREQHLDAAGITRQILTFTAPGTLLEEPQDSVRLARRVNDALAKAKQARGDRFSALATLPLNDPKASADELERAVTELGFRGFMVFGNVNGVALSDRVFWPLYERAAAHEAVFYIHPTFPPGVEAMTDYWLMPLVGFMFDTTLAAASLVFSGVVDRFPQIRWVLAHLGGAVPYLVERLDRGYEAFRECREHITKPPSEYLKDFYYDTVNFDRKALTLALEYVGPERLVAGSDYPHMIGSLSKMVSAIDGLDISDASKQRIFSGNATELLGL